MIQNPPPSQVLYELYDRRWMAITMILVQIMAVVSLALFALVTWGILGNGSNPRHWWGATSALGASLLLGRTIAIWIRLARHYPTLILTNAGIQMRRWFGYRKILWDEFDAALLMRLGVNGGRISIRYRPTRPSLIAHQVMKLRDGWVQASFSLDTIAIDTPDIAARINQTRDEIRAGRTSSVSA
jgi:hypothetical protein